MRKEDFELLDKIGQKIIAADAANDEVTRTRAIIVLRDRLRVIRLAIQKRVVVTAAA